MSYEEKEKHNELLKQEFDKLVKNRALICDEKGVLKTDCTKYKKKYKTLLTKVKNLQWECIKDDITYFYIPDTTTGYVFKKMLEIILQSVSKLLIQNVKTGSYEKFEEIRNEIYEEMADMYIFFIIKKDMHQHLYKKGA